MADISNVLKALSNSRRLQIVEWLRDPENHFPPQVDGNLLEDGVCIGFLTRKLGISQPSVTAHMKHLENAGLVTSKQIKNWVFYKLQETSMEEFMTTLSSKLQS